MTLEYSCPPLPVTVYVASVHSLVSLLPVSPLERLLSSLSLNKCLIPRTSSLLPYTASHTIQHWRSGSTVTRAEKVRLTVWDRGLGPCESLCGYRVATL